MSFYSVDIISNTKIIKKLIQGISPGGRRRGLLEMARKERQQKVNSMLSCGKLIYHFL